jgi:hypothetical protein
MIVNWMRDLAARLRVRTQGGRGSASFASLLNELLREEPRVTLSLRGIERYLEAVESAHNDTPRSEARI